MYQVEFKESRSTKSGGPTTKTTAVGRFESTKDLEYFLCRLFPGANPLLPAFPAKPLLPEWMDIDQVIGPNDFGGVDSLNITIVPSDTPPPAGQWVGAFDYPPTIFPASGIWFPTFDAMANFITSIRLGQGADSYEYIAIALMERKPAYEFCFGRIQGRDLEMSFSKTKAKQ